ncbi:phosphoribosylanthranilate isomerase [Alkalilimnicola ehrlichii MLHE-1]|uniref:N-(5'-phosphoribosyl)anthranilate isomerase n=1 Tax=Alkalilimnicola ehrlichii (strain ATCC BAA-1101 / DSM 17681 / MLHE-1) TaxID=187272 RepID=Q0A9A3_ALKEH|nr:phosphoribosylanthranilate isomerase [Alkalilimnicola ehrlichii MLHE-1]
MSGSIASLSRSGTTFIVSANSFRTRVKICGITRPEDGRKAAQLGADAVGLVFHERSCRAVDRATAQAVIDALPPFVTVVALFQDPQAAFVRQVLRELRIDLLQFHGDEAPEFCEGFHRRYIKAIPMGEPGDPKAWVARYPSAVGFLLDSHSRGASGGSGEIFDWARVPHDAGVPLILAGGLSPENVGGAVRQARPFAVDVSTGVESAPGVKDPELMAAFISEVSNVHQGD